jgi:predicted dehydrogenase
MIDIVLFGTGNLGKRYIQAISKLKDVNLFLYDISSEALSSVKDFVSQNNITSLRYEILSSFSEAEKKINKNSIVIVATASRNRMEILGAIIQNFPKAIICEKPVTQKLEEYVNLLELLKENGTKSFVDFTLRMQPFYQAIKNEIGKVTSGVFYANLPKMGLACVGIHQIDLFMWLFNLQNCQLKNSTFVETYEQKRKGFFDITGSMELESGNFKAFINNDGFDNFRTAQIITDNTVYNVHEDQRVMTKIKKAREENLISESISYSFVSQYMTSVVSNIIENKFEEIPLPSLEESFVQHKVLFEYLSKHSLLDLNFT